MTSVTKTPNRQTAQPNPLIGLASVGQSVWLDFVERKLLRDGGLRRLIEQDGVRGMTSNPTIFEKAIAAGNDYDDQLGELAARGLDAGRIFEALAVTDIQNACDQFRALYDSTGGADGFVSIEVSPTLARDTAATLEDARRLWREVDRPNVMVKIPGTREAWPAIQQALRDGINVNVTLLFSVEHHAEVMQRYLAALEQRVERGEPIDRIVSVASFFVSRVDTAIDRQLEQKLAGAPPAEADRLRGLLGQGAIANAKLAYAAFREVFASERFERLRARGARVQRPLWASTGAKNPAYRDVLYVEELIGPDTVNTMPLATLEAFRDHGRVTRTVDRGLERARAVLEELREVGIDLDAVTEQLEVEGVEAFAKSFEQLLQGVERKRVELRRDANQ